MRIIVRGLTEEEYETIYPLQKQYGSWDKAFRKFVIPVYVAIAKYKMGLITADELIQIIDEVVEDAKLQNLEEEI